MIQISDDDRRRAFVVWLRTGRLPRVPCEDGLEFKFNPWHDPANGRFTFAGSGQHSGGSGPNRTGAGHRTSEALMRREPAKLPIGTRSALTARRTEGVTVENRAMASREGAGEPQQPRAAASAPRRADRADPKVAFARGAAEGLYDTVAGAARDTYSLLTTNPATTARETGRTIAHTIDRAVAAEDVPARIRVSRAADALGYASAHDLGRAAGSAAGNVALTVLPGAALSKVSALRRLRAVAPRGVAYDPPEIGWVKENLGRDNAAKRYNDGAPGARPNQAPTLRRTMPDGSKRSVKFDGIQGEYPIDRKWKVVDAPRARAQLLRQSEALAQHSGIGIWEVPNRVQKIKAERLFKKMNVTNIKVRVVKL